MNKNVFRKTRIASWEARLPDTFPTLNADAIFDRACTILYDELHSVNDRGNRMVGVHIRKNILPGYACYRALLDSGVDSGLAAAFVEAELCRSVQRMSRLSHWLSDKKATYTLVVRALRLVLCYAYPIKAAFQKFSIICCELGLIGKEIVAVDGSKFRASNSRLKYHSEKKIEEKIKHHAEKAEMYMELLDACDRGEDVQPTLTREEILGKINKVNKRLVELSTLKEEVSKNGTIYETDRDSRMMKTNNNGCDICHNVQIAVDDKAHLVVAVDVTSQPVDKEQLYNMASQAKGNLETDEITVVADKGYYSSRQFMLCEIDGIKPIVSCAKQDFHAKDKQYSKERFQYYDGGYICPAGETLIPFCKAKDNCIKYANPSACKDCSQKANCTTGEYRMVQDRPFSEFAREVDKRTKEQMDTYHLRKQVVEHPFGTIKRAFGFSYFLTRGTENVRTESLLHFLVYNMKRAINMVGMQELRAALQG